VLAVSEINEELKNAFEKNKIIAAIPIRNIHHV
jgi:hypothetical protein